MAADIAGHPRSSHWPAVRDAHLQKEPCCQICGSRKDLQVHHIRPYHLHPTLELDPTNLITLCEEPDANHHLWFGHFGNFHDGWNAAVRLDASHYRKGMAKRTTGGI